MEQEHTVRLQVQRPAPGPDLFGGEREESQWNFRSSGWGFGGSNDTFQNGTAQTGRTMGTLWSVQIVNRDAQVAACRTNRRFCFESAGGIEGDH